MNCFLITDGEEAEVFGNWEESLQCFEVDSLCFEFGEDSVIGGEAEEVQFADTFNSIVLLLVFVVLFWFLE